MGPVVMLVHAEVFKTFREARAVSAGFDSQTVPPFLSFFHLTLLMLPHLECLVQTTYALLLYFPLHVQPYPFSPQRYHHLCKEINSTAKILSFFLSLAPFFSSCVKHLLPLVSLDVRVLFSFFLHPAQQHRQLTAMNVINIRHKFNLYAIRCIKHVTLFCHSKRPNDF